MESITTTSYAGMYSVVSLAANTNYTFSSSVTTDYITITNSTGTTVLVSGTTPLVWNTGENSGLLRYYIHTNSSCGTQNVNRTKYIQCGSSCNPPTAVTATATTTSTAALSWAAPTSGIPSGYQYAVTTSATPPASGTATTSTSVPSYPVTAGTTYYLHVRSNCSGTYSNWATSQPFSSWVPGELCEDAIDLATLTSPYTSTTVGTANNYSSALCPNNGFSSGPDLYYYITVPVGATIAITQVSNNYDSMVSVGYGACPGSTTITCFNDPDEQTVTWTNNTGIVRNVYWVQDGYNNQSGSFTLSWTLTPACTTPAPIASAQSFASGATVANLTATGTALKWYTTATGGTALASTTVLATGIYYVSQTLNGCEGSRTAVNVTITASSILYVKQGSTGNGTSWTNAMGQLADALKSAAQNPGIVTQIWVAGGVYKPKFRLDDLNSTSLTDRDNTFKLVDNVKVYGGFAGNEGALSERNLSLTANASILSGDFSNNDTYNSLGICTGGNSENAYHVVCLRSSTAETLETVLDGFTIKGGNANGGVSVIFVSQKQGGGIHSNGLATFKNLIITGNASSEGGGGVYSTFNNSIFDNLSIIGNATFGSGTLSEGGGIDIVFDSPILKNCIIKNNTAEIGGGLNSSHTSATIINTLITNNTASMNGGGVFNLNSGGSTSYFNTDIINNTATFFGGGTYVIYDASQYTNCIVYNNTSSSSTLQSQNSYGSATFTYSIVQGLSPLNNGNSNVDPGFTNATNGDYTLLATSPAINAGTNTPYTAGQIPGLIGITTDLAGNPRFYNAGTIDIGAYEHQGASCNTPAPAASAQSFCNSATVANLTATGTGLKWYAALTGGIQLAGTAALANGTYYVSQTLNGCESTRTAVAVTITTTTAPTASAQSFCNIATVANLVATGTALKWYAALTGGSQLAGTTALATGNYYVSQTLNGCESTRTAVAVTVNVTTAPTASAQTFCNSATVADLVATGTGLKWYAALTGGAQLAGTTALATGTYYVSQTLNGCESTRTAVSVTVNVTTAPTASAQSFCNSATVANLVATGTSLKWYAALTGGAQLAGTTALATGTYYVSQTLNGCESTRTAVAVTINVTTPPTASAQTFCNSATVANLVATGTALKWYAASTGGTQLAGTTALATGTYYVSQTLNGCESTRTAVAVTITTTAAPTASAQSFCNSATVANLTATGASLKWYAALTGGTQLAGTTALATGTYYVSQTLNGCESTRTAVAVTINVTAAPTASAQSFCNSATVANLTATGTGLKWYAALTGGTQLAGTTALATGTYYVSQTLNGCESTRTAVAVTITTTAAPTASAQSFCNSATVANLTATGTGLKWYAALTGGTQLAGTTALATGTYYVSQTLNNCESTRTAVAVTITTTAAPTASAQSFCNSATVANLTATGTSLKWYAALTGGAQLAGTTTLATGNYYVSQTLNGCESTRTAVEVTITTTAAPTASAQSFCNSATVADLTAAGTGLQWYAALTGGIQLAGTAALANGTYYVSQTLNGCEGPRTAVAVTINVTPIPSAPDQVFCNSATVANLTATGTALKWYANLTGGAQLAGTTALATGTYYVSQTLNSCESTRTAVAVTITTTAAPTASAQTFCNSATVANLTATGTALKWYAALTGGSQLAGTTALATGTYYVSQTLNGCESTRTAVAVTINVTAAPTASAQSFCNSATVANLTATGTALKWYAASTVGTQLAGTTALATGTYYVSQTLNSCESTRTAVAVTITTTAAPTASAQTFCNSATVANLTATGTALKWYAALTGGAQLAGTTALATGTYYVSQTLNNCESTRTAVAVTINVTAAPTTSAQTFCNSTTVAELVATGTSLKWYANLTGGTQLAGTTALATGTYYVSQTLNSCESTRTAVAVTITTTAAPTASAQSFCNSATVANLTATGTALKWYAASTGGTQLAGTTALATGTYYVSQTLNSCESTRTAVAVTITTTAAPTASAQTFCNSATVANLTATGTSLKWYAALTGGTQLAGTTALATGTYYVSQTLNSCESTRTAVSVTINVTAAPTASAQSFCNSATVANLTATGTGLKWYAALTGGTQLAGTTALATGTYYVSQTLNGCESTRTAVAVTITTTAAPTASAQSFCNSATVANLVATGISLKWYAALTGGAQLAGTTALATGTYYVSQTLNGCESTRTAVAVTITTTAAPTASAQSFCNSATVANLVATGISLKWYAALTGGAQLAGTTALATGTYYVSQTLNGCESTRTAVAVTITTTAAPTASAQSFCNSATVANLVATGISLKWYAALTGGAQLAVNTALATGTYYVSQTLNSCESTRTAVAVTITTTAAPTASAQSFCNSATVANLIATGTALKWYAALAGGTQLAGTTALATGTYYVSQTLNGCESTRTAVEVTITTTAAPTATAQSFCNSATVADLVATGTSIQWYAAATGGTALTASTELATGTYYVSQTISGCESTRTSVAVTINVTSAPTASAQTFCNSATVANLTAIGTSPKWYANLTGGIQLAGTTALATGTYYVSQTLNGCESTRTAVAVTITATAAPTASAQSFCNSATVANLTATGTSLKWYANLTGGTQLAGTTALATGTYYVSQTINGCESTRTAVAVTINVTAAPTASAQSFCNSATVANLTATGTALNWYTAATGGTALATTTALTTGNYYVSQTLNNCESTRTAVAVTINVTAAPTASAQSFCNSATVANLTATGTGLKWYAALTGGAQLAGTTALATGTYYVSQTLNGCESTRTAVAVTVNVTAAPTASAQTFCNSTTVAELVATGAGLQWYADLTGGTALTASTTLATGTYYVSQTIAGCESTRTAVSVTINVTATPTASAQTFCNSATVANLVATGTSLKWYANLTGGTQLAGTTALATGTYYVSQTLNNCESTRTAVSVTINVTAAPTASAQTFCNSATVAELVATGAGLQWYADLTDGTALTASTALATGTYYVSQTISGCESTRTAVAVTINATAAPAASAQSFCNSATVADLTATGTGLQWYADLTGGTALSASTALATGTYYVSQTLNGCESTRTSVSVTVNVTTAPTASAQSFCNSATIAELVATGAGLQWYADLTGGTALTASTELATGTYYVSQTLNGCESTRTAVSVTVNVTTAPTASAQTFCNSATVAELVSTGAGLQWYADLTDGTALTASTELATGTYYVSQTLNGCESTRTSVSVTVNVTTAPAASAQTFCNSATVADLTATGTGLQWYADLTGGTALSASTELATGTYYVSQTINGCESTRTAVAVTINITTPPTASAQTFCNSATVAELVATGAGLQWYDNLTGGSALSTSTELATGTYYVSQTLNGCESTRTAVAVTINVTAAPAASAQTFCNSATVADLTATGTGLQWYADLTGGTALSASTALATGTYYVSQTIAGCESTRTAVAITINVTAAPAASAQSFCNSATVAELIATGTGLQWYADLTSGTALTASTELTTGTYYVSQTINGCESTRTAVAVTINITTPPTASAQTFCNSATVAELVATGAGLQWYDNLTGGSALSTSTELATGTYYVSQTLNGCESTRTAVAVTINVTAAPAASAQTFCNSATVADLTATGTGLQWYADLTGGTALSASTALATGTYYVSQTIAGCESTRTAVAVTINVTAAPAASAQSFCNSATVAELIATGTGLQWYADLTSGTALTASTELTTGTYYVSQTINGCESTRTAVDIVVNVVSAPQGAAIQQIAAPATIDDIIATGTDIQWYASLDDLANGNALAAGTPVVAGTTYYGTQTVDGCESGYLAVTISEILKAGEVRDITFSYFPNPVKDNLTIVSSVIIDSVSVYTILGQKVADDQWHATSGSVNMQALQEGSYVIYVNANGASKSFVILKGK
ncbi:T9SS type A sorting domain-containing protein [Flavobacterium sp. RHBU_24]|uniref:Ig-like domain-containing protein n=1 Tax=Flavobacterium sp. RHBU_24 TaxID=3391185 RepID=UPI0039847CCE